MAAGDLFATLTGETVTLTASPPDLTVSPEVLRDTQPTLTPGPMAPPPPARGSSLAVREVLLLPPAWLANLPEATTLALHASGGQTWYATTGAGVYEALRGAGELVCTGGELGAMAVAAEQDRASSLALAQWLAIKRIDPSMRLDVRCVLDGLADCADTPDLRWPLGRVLAVCAATLDRVGTGDAPHGPEWLP